MKKALRRIRAAVVRLRTWATDYEPARAAGIATTAFQGLAAAGIAVGDLPATVGKVLGVVAVAATLIQMTYVRSKVTPVANPNLD